MCIHVLPVSCICVPCSCSWIPETGVRDGCELPIVWTRNWTWVLCKTTGVLTTEPTLQPPWIFLDYFVYMNICPACIWVPHIYLVSDEVIRSARTGVTEMWAMVWVLELNPGLLSARTISYLNQWISLQALNRSLISIYLKAKPIS